MSKATGQISATFLQEMQDLKAEVNRLKNIIRWRSVSDEPPTVEGWYMTYDGAEKQMYFEPGVGWEDTRGKKRTPEKWRPTEVNAYANTSPKLIVNGCEVSKLSEESLFLVRNGQGITINIDRIFRMKVFQ